MYEERYARRLCRKFKKYTRTHFFRITHNTDSVFIARIRSLWKGNIFSRVCLLTGDQLKLVHLGTKLVDLKEWGSGRKTRMFVKREETQWRIQDFQDGAPTLDGGAKARISLNWHPLLKESIFSDKRSYPWMRRILRFFALLILINM